MANKVRKHFAAPASAVAAVIVLGTAAANVLAAVDSQTPPYRNPRDYQRLPSAAPRQVTGSKDKEGTLWGTYFGNDSQAPCASARRW